MAHSFCGEKLQGREEVGFLGGQKDHKTAHWRQGHCKKKMHWNLLPEDSERSEESSREGDGDPLQYSWLENPMDGGAWWAAVHAVVKSRTQLSDFTFTFQLSCTGEGNGNPLQYSWLENPMDGEAW